MIFGLNAHALPGGPQAAFAANMAPRGAMTGRWGFFGGHLARRPLLVASAIWQADFQRTKS